jgi:TolA-binding protein
MSRACGQAWKADALDDGTLPASDAASFEIHVRGCEECRARVRLDRRLHTLAAELPIARPLELPLHRIRARILSDAREEKRRRTPRWRLAGMAAGLLLLTLALTLAIGLRRRSRSVLLPNEPLAATVTAAPGAEWSQARHENLETVELTRGELWIVVRKQTEGERFVVDLPDGQLEVRGTTFDVVADAHSTQHVHVVNGRVELRLLGRAVVELSAGQTWEAMAPEPSSPTPAAVDSSASSASPSSSSRPPPLPHPVSSATPGDESRDYEAAMNLYRAGRYSEAADGFHRFAERYRDSAFLEDTTFLEALSLTKAGHADAGAVAAARHLAEFPRSFHVKEASVLVARAARDRGECDEARRAVASWHALDDVTIREALGTCLEP